MKNMTLTLINLTDHSIEILFTSFFNFIQIFLIYLTSNKYLIAETKMNCDS